MKPVTTMACLSIRSIIAVLVFAALFGLPLSTARAALEHPLRWEGSGSRPQTVLNSWGADSDPPVATSPGEDVHHDLLVPLTPPPLHSPMFDSASEFPSARAETRATRPLPSSDLFPMRPLVDGAEELWSVSPPHGPDATGKLSTTVEHGLLRLSLDTGVARDPVMPENIALQSYLMRLSLGQQALALGDVAVQETGLWKPLSSRGMHGSMNLRGLTGGLFLLKDPASATWDDPLTGAMVEKRLFSRDIRLRAMAALGDETRVSGMGLSAPLLGETLSLSGDLFRSDSDEAIGDALRVQGSGEHAGLAYSLGFSRFGPSYSNPFRPEQLGGHEETSLNLSKLLPFPGEHKLSAAYGLRLRDGPYNTLLIHDGRLGLTLGKRGWLITPSYTLSLTEPLLGDFGSVEQHRVSISAWLAPWPGVNLNPSLSYTQRTASSYPVLFETWHAGLKTILPIHPGSELYLALEGQECRSDGSFSRNQWSVWSKYAWSPAFLAEDRRQWTIALENRFSRRTSLTESLDEVTFSIRLDIPSS